MTKRLMKPQKLLLLFATFFFASIAFGQTIETPPQLTESVSGKGVVREASITIGASLTPTNVMVEVIDGLVLLDGDILLGTEADVFGGAAIYNVTANQWPNATVPYTIKAGYSAADLNMINYAINYVGTNSNLCLVPRTTEANYVEFNQDVANACFSSVGMRGGKQVINVVSACGIGSTIHEILHAVGHWHEQSRADRDTYVTIDLTNVPSSKQHNFNIYSTGADVGAYDYNSLMHYSETAFSSSGPSIIVKIPPGTASTDIGQRLNMSAGDIAAVNQVYTNNPTCSAITGLPVNLRIKNIGTLTVDPATGMTSVSGVVVENNGGAASVATTIHLMTGPTSTNSVSRAISEAIPALNAGATHNVGTLNYDGSSLSANTYRFGLWVDIDGLITGEGNTGDNRHFWTAPTLTTPLCSITADGLTDVACDDNGTNNNITDDKVTFKLNPTGTVSGTYNVTVSAGTITPTSASYGAATTFTLQNGSAGAGDVTVTMTDNANSNCDKTVSITDPGTCSSNAVDISFVIDDTGSMHDEINGVKDAIQSVIDTYDPSIGTVFQLVSFKDDFTVMPPTSDLATIRAQVAALVASGGGDCPEASYEALAAALTTLKVNGDLFLATDAAPHSGVDITALIAAAIANGTTISTVLTGDCGSTTFLTDVSVMDKGEYVPFSDNGGGKSQGTPMTESLTDFSAISAFSLLASATGGSFSFVPQVNGGDPLDKTLFKNIATNIINGAISQAIIDASPSDAPAGSTLNVTLTGSNTNFNSSTAVSFPSSFAGGITVNSVNVLNATSLEINVTVAGGASTGLLSATATTTVSGGAIETVSGTGIVKIVAAITSPTILSISPSTGAIGATMNVTISGAATNFDNTSDLDLGSGITINALTGNSATTITANITIAAGATVGFRDVTVTTGGETATEALTGPFLVTAATPDIIGTQDDFNISDPCSCTDPDNVTVGGVYLFHDVLTVTGTSGRMVEVITNDGEFRGADGVALSLTVPLTETTTGIYQVDFWHRSNVATIVTVQMDSNPGTNQTFTSSSCDEATCIVPDPVPTMNEWGLLIFGLLLLNLGLIFVYRKEALLK